MIFFKEKLIRLFFVFCVLFANLALANSLPFNWTDLNPLSSPSPREFPSLAFDSCSGQMVLFGGSQNSSSFNDTWIFDTLNNTWTELTPISSPPARQAASMAFDSSSGQIILFGGSDNGSTLNDTWIFDIQANTWTELTPATSPFSSLWRIYDL